MLKSLCKILSIGLIAINQVNSLEKGKAEEFAIRIYKDFHVENKSREEWDEIISMLQADTRNGLGEISADKFSCFINNSEEFRSDYMQSLESKNIAVSLSMVIKHTLDTFCDAP